MVSKVLPLPRIPVSTYRLQLNPRFTFSDAKNIVHYLSQLGITDLYASPYLKAKKGSDHGYDIVDHHQLNPEIGTTKEYDEFVRELQKYGMGQILDFVPNHMCIESNDNSWWMDILENGPSSRFTDFFDIDWKPPQKGLENKVLLPFLGEQYGKVLENQELRLTFEGGAFFVHYCNLKFPLLPKTTLDVLTHRKEALERELPPEHPHFVEFLSITTALNYLPSYLEKDPKKIVERYREKEIIKKRLLALHDECLEVRNFIGENLRSFNGTKGDPKSFDLLDGLLSQQVWRLSHWRVATEEINYRRFFDINSLAAIRMENRRVFEETHRLIFELIRQGKVTGLRVDHPDGLYDPSGYFSRLQQGCFLRLCLPDEETLNSEEASSAKSECLKQYTETLATDPQYKPFYILGEKILAKGEKIPEDWQIFSTIGYVFLNPVNGIFIDAKNVKAFDDLYARFIRSKVNYPGLVYEKKKLIMETAMTGEVHRLGHILNRLSERDRHTRDFTFNSLTLAIVETVSAFPVYRTYVTPGGVSERDRRYIEQAIGRAKRKNPALSATLFDFLQNVLLLSIPGDFNENEKREWVDFVMKFQQITAPVMAKGLEDTVFYVYNRFVSLNEVGGSPERFGTPLEAFHGQNIERAKAWPHSLNATSTHDTKRSEDVRARLNVLSEIPHEWSQSVFRWSRINKKKKTVIDGQGAPDRNEEYLLYQTLLGVWPLDSMRDEDYAVFVKRIKDYMLKSVREAKINSSWISPNLPYEEAIFKFIDATLSLSGFNPFLEDFEKLQMKIAHFGMFNALSQTLLKITSPGTPDFYQGTELWDFSLVDPDNRRPVDFALREQMLNTLKKRISLSEEPVATFARRLACQWRDGSVKLYVTFRSLNYRKANGNLFKNGAYLPLASDGQWKDHVCAFARKGDRKSALVIVPRFLTGLIQATDEMPLGEQVWRDTNVVLPTDIREGEFLNILTEEVIKVTERDAKQLLPMGQVFSNFPVALLESKPVTP